MSGHDPTFAALFYRVLPQYVSLWINALERSFSMRERVEYSPSHYTIIKISVATNLLTLTGVPTGLLC